MSVFLYPNSRIILLSAASIRCAFALATFRNHRTFRIPISAAVHALLDDARIKGDRALRIYIPLNQNDYIFLWGNDHFSYCDIRRLVREDTEEIDQGFIEALIVSEAHTRHDYIPCFVRRTWQGVS